MALTTATKTPKTRARKAPPKAERKLELVPPEPGHPTTYEEGAACYQPPLAWGPKPTPPPEVVKAMAEVRMLPARDRVLIWSTGEGVEEKTKGGLFIPDEAKRANRAFVAWILALGPDAWAQGWRPGDKVIISQYAGVIIPNRSAGEKALPTDLLREDDLLCLDHRTE